MIRKTAPALLAASMFCALPAFADGHMKLGDIKGESVAAKFKDWIVIDSVSEGVDVPVASTGSGMARAGRVQVRPITITKAVDSTTPQIRQAVVTGRLMKDAVIEYGKLTLTLKNVQITSASSQSRGNEMIEEVVLTATDISWSTANPAGGAKVEATYTARN